MSASIRHVVVTRKLQYRLSTYGKTNKDAGIILTIDSIGSEGIRD